MRILTKFYKSLFALSIAGLMSVSAMAQLSGAKTINPGGSGPNNYKTFTDAINSLNALGVGPGGVTFDVTGGTTYAELPPILTATGTAANPIVFRKAGTAANPVVKPSVKGTRYNTTLGNFHDGIIRIAYGDYITFDGIDVHDSAQFATDTARYEFGYFLMRKANNAPRHITIKNSRITLDPAMKYQIGIYQSKYDTTGTLATVSTEAGTCDSNFYESNTIISKNGIRLIGQATVGLYDENIFIRYNTLYVGGTTTTSYGTYTNYQTQVLMDQNRMYTSPDHTTTLYGFYLGTATNASVEMSNNRIEAGSRSTTYCFYVSSGASGTNNTVKIHHNKAVGPDLSQMTSGTFYGFYHSTAAQRSEVYNNIVDSVNRAGTGTTYGFYISGATKESYIHHNIVRGINTAGTTTLYGMYLLSALNGTVYNNQISGLYTQTSNSAEGMRGIFVSSGSWKFYYNTVYLDAQSTGAAFGSIAIYVNTTASIEMANNIFINKSVPGSTGYTVAYKRSTFSFIKMSAASDRNIYYAGTPGPNRLIYQDVTYNMSTLRDYRLMAGLSPRDMMSVSEDVPFLNTTTSPYNLNLSTSTATQAESMGRPIAGITDDFDGNTRSTSRPDAGAFEGSYTRNDLTPPGIGYTAMSHTSLLTNRNLTNVQIKDLSGVNVSAANKPRLYYRERGDTNGYVGNTSADKGWKYVIANNNVSPFNFTIDYSKLYNTLAVNDTIEYFVIAQDSVSTPNVGYNKGTLAVAPTSVVLTGSNFPLTGDINYYVIKDGISGVINVGSGQTYTTLTGAGGLFEAVNSRVVAGDIEANITSDIVEPGTVALDEYASDDPSYRVIIKPSAASARTLSGNVTKVGMIRFNRADGVIVDGRFGGSGNYLTFRNDALPGDSAAVFQLIGTDAQGGNGCKYITIRNTNIIGAGRKRATSFGILIGNTRVATIAGVENDNIQIISNNIMRSYYAINVRGDVTYGPSDSIEIVNNNIGSYDTTYFNGFRGIYLSGANECLIQGNKVFNVFNDSSLSVSLAGIELGTDAIDVIMKNNTVFKVVSTSTSTTAAAYGITMTGAENVTLYNNVVYGIKTNSYSATSTTYGPFGIRMTSGTGYKLYYNTVNLYDSTGGTGTGAAASAALVVTSTTVADLDIRNNIFANSLKRKNGSSKSFAIWFPSSYDFSEGITLDYNAYFVPAKNSPTTSFYVGREGTATDYITRNDWRSFSTQDAYSQPRVNQTPDFVNDTNVVIKDNVLSPAESTGIEISEIEVPNRDFNGNDRPKGTGTAPDLGAFEFEGIPGDFQAPRIDSFKVNLAGSQCVATPRTIRAYVTDQGGTGADTVSLVYSVNGVQQPIVLMTLASGTSAQGEWTGIIPAASLPNQRVVFNIFARDTAENISEMTEDSAYRDAYLVIDAGLPKTINENTSTRLIATKNYNGTVTWNPGGFSGDTLITPVLTADTRFYASITDGVCVGIDSVDVTVVTPVTPEAGFTESLYYVPTLAPVQLTDTSKNIPDFWKWNITPSTHSFVNGTTDTSQNPQVAFSKAGKYTIQLIARNAAGADTVTKVDVVEAYLEYCFSNVGDGQLKDNITRVRLNSLFWQDTAADRQFYSYVDYNALDTNVTTTLTRSKTYTLYAFNGGKRAGTVAAWIDYNLNGSFEDAGEKLGEQLNVAVNDSAAITFTVPATFDEGVNRLRVRIVGGAANLVSCANYSGGEEMLDYRLSLCDLFENPLVTSTEICGGDTVVADAMNPGRSFSWSTGSTDQAVSLTTAGEFEVTVSNDFCAIKDTIVINIKPGFGGASLNPATVFNGKPGDGAANPDTVCVGTTLDFDVLPPAAYGNAGFATQWFYYQEPATTESGTPVNGNIVFTSPFGGNNGKINFTPAAADGDSVYRLSLHFVNLISGCDSALVRYVKVNAPLNLNLGNDTSICQGNSLTLDAGIFAGYQWNTGANTSSITVNTSGRYAVMVTTAEGCTGADSVLVNVAATPVANLGKDTVFCFGAGVTLDAQNPGAAYAWSNGATTQTISVTVPGSYNVKVTNFAGCTDSDTIMVGMHSAIDASFTFTPNANGIGGNIAFNPATTTGVSYLWDLGDNFLTTVQAPVYHYTANGNYPVELTLTDLVTGCTASSNQQVLVNNLSVNDPALLGRKVQVYPNPYSNSTFLKYELGEAADVQITVYDITGKMVEQVSQGKQAPGQYQFEVHGGNYAGVYFVRVEVNKAVSTVRIVKQD